MRRGLRNEYGGRFVFTDHHESHAASAFFPSPFDEAAIMTLDGVGEWSTTCLGVGRGDFRIDLTRDPLSTRSGCCTQPSPTTPAFARQQRAEHR